MARTIRTTTARITTTKTTTATEEINRKDEDEQ
jgi:hypothetical protein